LISIEEVPDPKYHVGKKADTKHKGRLVGIQRKFDGHFWAVIYSDHSTARLIKFISVNIVPSSVAA
jgi:hypothetical protein